MLLRQHGGLSGLGLTLDTRLCHASETDVTPVLGRRKLERKILRAVAPAGNQIRDLPLCFFALNLSAKLKYLFSYP